MEVILKGGKIKSKEYFHKEIKILLELPEYYGANLDALRDCLTSWVDLPLTLRWQDFKASRIHMRESADKILDFFKSVEQEGIGFTLVIK
jgi:ribonuclease inhibitor